jgi:DNA-directed RNA polymerase subunit RPC12/RpoP
MPVTEATPFECLNCGAQYKLVRIETNETLPDQHLACRKCGGSRRQVHPEILLGGSSGSKGTRAACASVAFAARMPRKTPKLMEVRARIAEARRIVDVQIGLVARLRAMGKPTLEAEDLLNTYTSGLAHLQAYARTLREEANAKRARQRRSVRSRRRSSTAAPTHATTSRLGSLTTPKTMTSLTSR